LADGDEADLDGREPEREGPGVVLDEDAKKPFHGAVEGTMDHDRLVPFAVFAYILKLEAGGQVEVELDRRELPEAAQHVDQLEVDLGTVEGAFTLDGMVGDVLTLQ